MESDPQPPLRGREGTESAALVNLAVRYSAALTRYFRRRIGPETDVADLVQDVFLRLVKLSRPNEIQNVEHYIFATAANTLRDKARREAVRVRPLNDGFELDAVPDSAIPADRVLIGKQAIAQLPTILRELPERTRDIFILRIFEGKKFKDIAARLCISQRAVEKHYSRAVAHVAFSLRGYWDA